mgnify:CR=1 FL=1
MIINYGYKSGIRHIKEPQTKYILNIYAISTLNHCVNRNAIFFFPG